MFCDRIAGTIERQKLGGEASSNPRSYEVESLVSMLAPLAIRPRF